MDWTYDLTMLEYQKIKGTQRISSMPFSIESERIRSLKWGEQESDIRSFILDIYLDIWQQLDDMSRLYHTSQWIEYLLSNPSILGSPNEVNILLNVLFRITLKENYSEFVDIYTNKVLKLRGSASIGLHNWGVQSEGVKVDIPIEKKEAFEDFKSIIARIINTLEKKTN